MVLTLIFLFFNKNRHFMIVLVINLQFISKFQLHFKSLLKEDPLIDMNSSTILDEFSISVI